MGNSLAIKKYKMPGDILMNCCPAKNLAILSNAC
jgi:hypothetical protein